MKKRGLEWWLITGVVVWIAYTAVTSWIGEFFDSHKPNQPGVGFDMPGWFGLVLWAPIIGGVIWLVFKLSRRSGGGGTGGNGLRDLDRAQREEADALAQAQAQAPHMAERAIADAQRDGARRVAEARQVGAARLEMARRRIAAENGKWLKDRTQ